MNTNEEQAKQHGSKDYTDGVVVGDNPYKETDGLYWYWMQGYVTAALEARNKKDGRMNDKYQKCREEGCSFIIEAGCTLNQDPEHCTVNLPE